MGSLNVEFHLIEQLLSLPLKSSNAFYRSNKGPNLKLYVVQNYRLYHSVRIFAAVTEVLHAQHLCY